MARYLSAAAKVNLNLRVVGRYENGYHRLRSLVAFADFGDELRIEETSDAERILWRSDASVGDDVGADNILWRVLAEVRERISLPNFRIDLLKRIPMGGGLGGGSADAAALLGYLVRHYGLSQAAAYEVAHALGSDIGVCLAGRVCWLGGWGDEVIFVRDFPKIYGLLVWGLGALNTADVFGEFAQRGVRDYSSDLTDMPLSFASYGDLVNFLGVYGGNDLWDSAVALCPGLVDLRGVLSGLEGIGYVGMSGSGSVMFGLFEDYDLCCKGRDFLQRSFSSAQFFISAVFHQCSPRSVIC